MVINTSGLGSMIELRNHTGKQAWLKIKMDAGNMADLSAPLKCN